jgi:lipopolysaccharide transport system ATP-binding protein
MVHPVIKVENLSKKYIIGHQQKERYTALRDVIANNVKSVWRKTRELVQGRMQVDGEIAEEFWALKGINFEIRQGDRVGIIGRNGAGKSTLLKILSRITEPTEGRISIRGRVASLLEVGTGFHPELTGRENIFLNGAILGMNRAEIRAKFDEIVAFAEVEKFLDTPVKRYSSGMYVRLAFAVAAHLEPEILIVDEVLAVGDAQFQKKCLGKMDDVSKNEGRTVLFVSHNIEAIRKLCNKGIIFNKGTIQNESYNIEAIIAEYQGNNLNGQAEWRGNCENEELAHEYACLKKDQIVTANFDNSDEIIISTIVNVKKNIGDRLVICVKIYNSLDHQLMRLYFDDYVKSNITSEGRYQVDFKIPGHFLGVGQYRVEFDIAHAFLKRISNDSSNLYFYVNSDDGRGDRFKLNNGSVIRPNFLMGVKKL